MSIALQLEYNEIAQIRKWASEHKTDELPKMGLNADPQKWQHLLDTERNPLTNLGRCNRILDAIQKVEDEIKAAIMPDNLTEDDVRKRFGGHMCHGCAHYHDDPRINPVIACDGCRPTDDQYIHFRLSKSMAQSEWEEGCKG